MWILNFFVSLVFHLLPPGAMDRLANASLPNTGRSFIYRQASVNGEFIVPYATTGNSYDVKTMGKYTISSTGKQYEVPESAVLQGMTVE